MTVPFDMQPVGEYPGVAIARAVNQIDDLKAELAEANDTIDALRDWNARLAEELAAARSDLAVARDQLAVARVTENRRGW
jgi:hypothetical protein